MALSKKTRRIVEVALADRVSAKELADAVDAGANASAPQGVAVADIGATADTSTPVVTPSAIPDNTAGSIDAALDTKADNADVVTLRNEVEARLDVIEAKIDALLGSLRTAGLIAP